MIKLLYQAKIVLIASHFLTFAKFRGKGQIPQLGLKFHNPQKTVGSIDNEC